MPLSSSGQSKDQGKKDAAVDAGKTKASKKTALLEEFAADLESVSVRLSQASLNQSAYQPSADDLEELDSLMGEASKTLAQVEAVS